MTWRGSAWCRAGLAHELPRSPFGLQANCVPLHRACLPIPTENVSPASSALTGEQHRLTRGPVTYVLTPEYSQHKADSL